MKPVLTRFILALSLCFCLIGGASAKPPTLEPASEFPSTVLPSHQYEFHLTYKQPEGDPPDKMQMVVDAPYGQVTQSGHVPAGDPAAGVDLDWSFTPQQSGQYEYHFEVISTTGGVARYPAGTGGLEMDSPNPIIKYVVLAVGFVIALFFLPFLVYLTTRSLNKQSDPAAAARVALLIGLLSFCALSWYLFLYNSEDVPSRMLGVIIEVVAVGAFLVVLLNRRRAV